MAGGNIQPDPVLTEIADYVSDYVVESEEAYETARYCLMDSIGCGLLALRYPECAKLVGPVARGDGVFKTCCSRARVSNCRGPSALT